MGRWGTEIRGAEGGFSRVYAADHPEYGSVVNKVGRSDNPKISERLRAYFEMEADVYGVLEGCRRVPKYLGCELTKDFPSITLERINGPSLRMMLNNGAYGSFMLPVARSICEAVHEITAKGVINLDLKPENIMFRDGEIDDPVILDFGIATLDSLIPFSPSGKDIVGSPWYMAPEHIRREKISGKATVYQMGCVVFEMLSGKAVFEGTPKEALISHLKETPPLLHDVADIDENDSFAVDMALSKNPNDRFANCEEFKNALSKQ